MKKSNALWGVLLIFIGLIWIIGSTDMIRIDLFGAVQVLWPIFIIAAGVTFFISKDAHVMRVILWVLVFAIIGGYGVYLGYQNVSLEGGSHTFEMRNDVKSARLQVDLGAANLQIGSTASTLANVDSNISDLQYKSSGGANAQLRVFQKTKVFNMQSGRNFTANLNNSVPWELEINTGAIDGKIDYSDVALTRCDINTGACDLRIVAGDEQNESLIRCNGGAVNISLTVPEGVGVKVQSNAAVSNVRGNGIKMNKDGREYKSGNYSSAGKVVILEVNSGTSDITINVQ